MRKGPGGNHELYARWIQWGAFSVKVVSSVTRYMKTSAANVLLLIIVKIQYRIYNNVKIKKSQTLNYQPCEVTDVESPTKPFFISLIIISPSLSTPNKSVFLRKFLTKNLV